MNAEEKAKTAREARERAERCRDWLKTLMLPGHPKPATKDELYAVAKENLGVNRSNFDTGWDWAIWDMGREDWYESCRVAGPSLSEPAPLDRAAESVEQGNDRPDLNRPFQVA